MFSVPSFTAERKARDFFERFGVNSSFTPSVSSSAIVLPGQRRLWLGQDADEVFHGERLQLHADGESGPAVLESNRSASRRGTRPRPRTGM